MPDADVEFLTGGTQTNAVVISTMLADYEGVVAAHTGHVSTHEAEAIEYTGHEVLEIAQKDGKLVPDALERYLSDFYADGNHEHMTFPGMVYITHPTEYGTLYSKGELEAISEICRRWGLPLYLDGARLGYGVMSRGTDVTMADIARLCDVFYIGRCVHAGEQAEELPDLRQAPRRAARQGAAAGRSVRRAVYGRLVF